MSIFDHLMILIDDRGQLGAEEIETALVSQSKQIIGSALGRLVSRGWLVRIESGGRNFYRVTAAGNVYISRILSAIRRHEDSWNGQWFCVIVTLPEGQRKQRDVLRHHLLNKGFGRLIDGLYISPWERRAEVNEIIRRLNIGPSVFMLETQPLGQATCQVVVSQAWDWQALTQRLSTFLTRTIPVVQEIETIVHQQNSSSADTDINQELRLRAKLIVFAYGLMLSADANLPLAIIPSQETYRDALRLYERVREYCYR